VLNAASLRIFDFRESDHRLHLKAIIVFIPGDEIGANRFSTDRFQTIATTVFHQARSRDRFGENSDRFP